jgi:hypothetical protein
MTRSNLPASTGAGYAAQHSGYQAQAASAPQVGAAQAHANGDYSQFADAMYAQAQRMLDPQYQQEEAAFRQRMVNQGIQEGTPAFDQAYANYTRSREDAYSNARNQAIQ